jgi:hypothetical protein
MDLGGQRIPAEVVVIYAVTVGGVRSAVGTLTKAARPVATGSFERSSFRPERPAAQALQNAEPSRLWRHARQIEAERLAVILFLGRWASWLRVVRPD